MDDDKEQDDASRWDNVFQPPPPDLRWTPWVWVMSCRADVLTVWAQVIFNAEDPFDPLSWSEATHFEFEGYDPSPFWDDDGKVYVTGAHAWQVRYVSRFILDPVLTMGLISTTLLTRGCSPGIHQAEVDLRTGEVGEWEVIWEGTGGEVSRRSSHVEPELTSGRHPRARTSTTKTGTTTSSLPKVRHQSTLL